MRVLSLIYNEKNNAGPKAPADVDRILEKAYSAKTRHVIKTGHYKLKVFLEMIKCRLSRDVIVAQFPLLYKQKAYKVLNKNKTIIFIHDINGLRNQNKDYLANDIGILKQFHYIVVHNDTMKEYLIEQGIPAENMYVLEIFDYLVADEKDSEVINKVDDTSKYEEDADVSSLRLIYPGNLIEKKSPFIYQLENDKLKYSFNLYGLGVDKDISDKLTYKGAFEPDHIEVIKGDIGLIWDGNYDESDETETYKNYTRYNNPHKLSCCMALGVPVIVWRKAAIANFVKKYDVGYVIDNIYAINDIDFSDYKKKKENAMEICQKVKSGYFTRRVVEKVLKDMNSK